MSQIAFETPSRPRSCTRPARRNVRDRVFRHPELRPGLGSEIGDRAGMAEGVRRLQVDEVRDREQRRVEPLRGEHDRERRLGLDHRIPRRDRVKAREDHVRLRAHELRQLGVKLLAGALSGEFLRRVNSPDPVRDLDELRQLREPRRDRYRLAFELARPPAPVPLLVCPAESRRAPRRQPQLLTQGPRDRGVMGDHVIHLAVARERELEPDTESMKRWVASAQPPHTRRRRPQSWLVVVLGRLQRDVIAEPPRLLVRVGMTADVDEQSRVVDDRPRLLVKPDPLAKPQRDQALAQHVLHWLPETEVDPERKRRDELSQPNMRAISLASHTPRLPRPAEPR